MKFYVGEDGQVGTVQGTLGWPPEAENDPYTEPLSTVSYMTHNPYPKEETE